MRIRRQRFECQSHKEETRSRFDQYGNRLSFRHSATVTQFHPDFNLWKDEQGRSEMPPTSMKNHPFFAFNSVLMSERFYVDVITNMLIHPNGRAITASITNRNSNNLQALETRRDTMKRLGCPEPMPTLSHDIREQYRSFTLTGVGRATISLMMRHYWHTQGHHIAAKLDAGTLICS